MAAFDFYHDLAGAPDFTRAVTAGDPLLAGIDIDIGGQVEKRIWFGSDQAGQKVEANSDPGVDQINVALTDADGGNTNPTTRFRLATTQAGLAGAGDGASLDIGTVVNGGAGNAKQVWSRYTGPANENAGTPITYTDLGMQTNQLKQTAI